MNIFQYYLDENHLKPGTKLKKGDEELKVVKPVGDDKYLVKEEDLDEANLPKWEVSYDYGPHMSTSEEVSAKTKEDAAKKVIAAAKKKGLHPMLNYVRSVGVKEEVGLTEAKVGDSVWVRHPTDKWKTLTGRVKAIHSNDQITVTHRDGSTKTYPKTSVSTDYESLHANPYKKPVATESAELMKTNEEDLDEALAYKQTHEKWGVVPKSKKEFVKFFDVNKEAEARAHAAKTGGTLKKIDQMGRAIKEGAEQIDELSKNTLSGYVAKASSSKVWHQDNAKYARHDQQDDIADEEEAKANKRKAGIKRAISKIAKEEGDINEDTLTEMKRAIASAIAKRVAESARSEFSANMSMASSSTPSSAKKYRLVHKKTGATRGVFASHSSAKSALDIHPLKKHLVIEELTSDDLTQID